MSPDNIHVYEKEDTGYLDGCVSEIIIIVV